MNAEQVVINIIAHDNASKVLSKISANLSNLQRTTSTLHQNVGNVGQQNANALVVSQKAQDDFNKSTAQTGKSFDDVSKKSGAFGKDTKAALELGVSAFHEMNTIMATVGGQFTDLSNKIAGLFGAASLSDMIGQMWTKAAERQTNMLYLIHQRGTEQANEYYNEIMDIVTQLPGDDTFLTNILNMSAAMDKNIKVDKLKELGTAITDYYIASTMKGEIPFEVERDMRKYMTTGETRPLRNSLLANEIDLLKGKNTVLERGMALQKALEKNGFAGMSEYESAKNELEEFKGHFQKAMTDIGTIVTAITQPLMKFYNTLDTVFGSRVSQAIILVAMAFVGLFAVIGIGMIMFPMLVRNVEILGMSMTILNGVIDSEVVATGSLNAVLTLLIGLDNAERIAKDGSVLAGIRSIKNKYAQILVNKLVAAANAEETISIWGVITATGGLIKTKIVKIATIIKEILFGFSKAKMEEINIILTKINEGVELSAAEAEFIRNAATSKSIRTLIGKRLETIKDTIATIGDAVATELNTLVKLRESGMSLKQALATWISTKAKNSETLSNIRNTLIKIRNMVVEGASIAVKLVKVAVTMLTTGATFSEAMAIVFDTEAKTFDIAATLGLTSAMIALDAAMLPIILPILAIIAGIAALILLVEKLGEAFGWWKDFGSMFEAIANGIKRIWNAFLNNDIIRGIIDYFQRFVASIQYVIESLQKMFGVLFNFGGGSFDIVQSIIDIFGKLGDVVKWVWSLIDAWANSPLGIITWLNPLGILIFHLDEIGSFFEDIGDAINRFMDTVEFQQLVDSFNEAWAALQEPFQEIWSIITEIMDLIGEVFSGEEGEGRGTEERINFLVELFKGLAFIIRTVVVPAIKAIAFVIKVILTPIRAVLTVVREVIKAIQWATQVVNIFGVAWSIITAPIRVVQKILEGVGNVIKWVSDAIKNSLIGKLLGWDKEGEDNKDVNGKVNGTKDNLYDQMKQSVKSSDMNFVTKHQILGELDKQSSTNVNDMRNMSSVYNHNDNQRQVVVNNNFSEGSMPIDARNMTKKEARKMFIGAFGYRRAVGYNGILR